jgi:hypothetical protein
MSSIETETAAAIVKAIAPVFFRLTVMRVLASRKLSLIP